jgi:hypothetical protein
MLHGPYASQEAGRESGPHEACSIPRLSDLRQRQEGGACLARIPACAVLCHPRENAMTRFWRIFVCWFVALILCWLGANFAGAVRPMGIKPFHYAGFPCTIAAWGQRRRGVLRLGSVGNQRRNCVGNLGASCMALRRRPVPEERLFGVRRFIAALIGVVCPRFSPATLVRDARSRWTRVWSLWCAQFPRFLAACWTNVA